MSNEEMNNAIEEEILDNVEFTTEEEPVAETGKVIMDEPKQNKFVQMKNKALGFVGKHKFVLGVITGVAGVVAADRAIASLQERKASNTQIVDGTFVEINEPTENVEEVNYPQEEEDVVEDTVEE